MAGFIVNTTPLLTHTTTLMSIKNGAVLEYTRGVTTDIQLITQLCNQMTWFTVVVLSLILALLILKAWFAKARPVIVAKGPDYAGVVTVLDGASGIIDGLLVFYVVVQLGIAIMGML